MIDWERAEALRAEIGAEDFCEVVDLFLEEVEEVIARLRATPDPAHYEDDLHFLKGSALNLGFADLAALCHRGERQSAEGRAGAVDIAGIVSAYDRSKHAFMARAQPACPCLRAG